jgi:hypothetical protein
LISAYPNPGREWGVTIQASIVPILFKETQMTKLRIQVALYMFVLSASVAVISGVVPVRVAGAEKHNLPAIQSNGLVILTADGTDPQPKPTPLPWLGVVS